jgi:hypothetical protein
MRTTTWIVIVFLLVGVIAFTWWPRASIASMTPPGQYPIDEPRFEWPMKERIKAYRPGKTMGSDGIVEQDAAPIKARCALATSCSL